MNAPIHNRRQLEREQEYFDGFSEPLQALFLSSLAFVLEYELPNDDEPAWESLRQELRTEFIRFFRALEMNDHGKALALSNTSHLQTPKEVQAIAETVEDGEHWPYQGGIIGISRVADNFTVPVVSEVKEALERVGSSGFREKGVYDWRYYEDGYGAVGTFYVSEGGYLVDKHQVHLSHAGFPMDTRNAVTRLLGVRHPSLRNPVVSLPKDRFLGVFDYRHGKYWINTTMTTEQAFRAQEA